MTSSSRTSNDSSWGRRTSMLALSALGRYSPINDGDSTVVQKLRKKQRHSHRSSLNTDLTHPDLARSSSPAGDNEPFSSELAPTSDPHQKHRPSLSIRGTKRPSSVFDSLRVPVRSYADDQALDTPGEPLSAVSTSSYTFFGDASMDGAGSQRTVLLHGEVQTSAGMFRKKKEYLVLTETHIVRYKSQTKAAEVWKVVPTSNGRPPIHTKQSSMTSFGSQSDLQTASESSGDKDGRVSLRQVVAVQRLDDGKPYFAVEVAFLDEESGYSSSLTLQFGNPEDRDNWLVKIRTAANEARLRSPRPISTSTLEHAARIIERDRDYDPANCAVYKIMQRQTASKLGRSSSEDITKVACNVSLLAIGVHKVHFIQLAKAQGRTSSPSVPPNTSQASYGILTLSSIRVSDSDDSFELTFRQPLQKPRQLYLASSVSYEIAVRLRGAENALRPECGHRLFKFNVPPEVENLTIVPPPAEEEHHGLDRTLAAYCISYGINPTNVRYTINYDCEDSPRFELLPPADTRRPDYGPIALLAVMRALRYNESFGSLSFAGISLDSLNGLHDPHGREYICSRTKRGTPIRLSVRDLAQSCLLVQEVRALAATSKKLRRMDFSNCISDKAAPGPLEPVEEEQQRVKDIGCGIVEALGPLCRQQITNVDWICLNGIQLGDTDMDYLVGAAVDKSCHFRAIELNRCGVSDRNMGLLLDALRAQDNTLEAIEIGGNTARLNPATFDSQLSVFGFIRKLNLSYVPRTSGTEPLLTAETLLIWRLQELRLSGTTLNQATIDAVATYLAHPQSTTLHELYFDNAYLSGGDVATLFHSMSLASGQPRNLHLDISQNNLAKDLDHLTQAIAAGLTPSHLSIRAIEYREETHFRKMLAALTINKSISYLDMSQTALPGDASDETCRALCKLLADNETLLELDLSGEDSRLASSKFGPGINDVLVGLKHNTTLHSFRIEKQKLGLQGASTLAEVLKENSTLRELHCDRNEIPLHGLTDLVNSLIENTTLTYLPSMDDGRRAALHAAEITMKAMSDLDVSAPPTLSSRSPSFGGAGVKRGLASVRRSAARTASAYAPSFPALPTTSPRSSSSSDRHSSTASSITPFTLRAPPTRHTTKSKPSPQSSTISHTTAIPSHQPSFSIQDIQTTHRLLSEQWDRQVYRLTQYLERNWCLLHSIPVNMEIEDEKFERPSSSVGSIGKLLLDHQQQARRSEDRTPRAEKEFIFDANSTGSVAGSITTTAITSTAIVPASAIAKEEPLEPERHTSGVKGLGFKHFLLGGEGEDEEDEDDALPPPAAAITVKANDDAEDSSPSAHTTSLAKEVTTLDSSSSEDTDADDDADDDDDNYNDRDYHNTDGNEDDSHLITDGDEDRASDDEETMSSLISRTGGLKVRNGDIKTTSSRSTTSSSSSSRRRRGQHHNHQSNKKGLPRKTKTKTKTATKTKVHDRPSTPT